MSLFASDHPDDMVGDSPVPGPEWTPPPARAPRTGRFDLDEWDQDADSAGGRRRWLLAAAVVPWAVVVAVMLTGDRGTDPEPAPPTDDRTPATTAPAEPLPPTPTATTHDPDASGVGPAPGADVVTAVGSSTGTHGTGEAAGLALVAARTWLSTRPAGASIDGLSPAPGAEDRYVEHLAVESVDHPARGALVVTVRAIVLPVDGDAYGAAQAVRIAVPVVLDTGRARLGGAPWHLPSTDVALDPPQRAPVDDPDLMVAAVDAVRATGYREVDLVTLSRTSGWAWIAEVRATAPGEDVVRTHAIWLRSDVGRLVVAGARAPDPARPPTSEDPDGAPSVEPTAEPTSEPAVEPAEEPS